MILQWKRISLFFLFLQRKRNTPKLKGNSTENTCICRLARRIVKTYLSSLQVKRKGKTRFD